MPAHLPNCQFSTFSPTDPAEEPLIKALMSGADVAMVTSAIYCEGPDTIRIMLDGLTRFMEVHHMRSLSDLQTRRPLQFTSEQARAAYIAALTAHLGATETAAIAPSAHGDQWGHPTAWKTTSLD